MEGKFIYVFDADTKDVMIAKHYNMLFEKNGVFVFENRNDMKFSANNMNCVFSDTLTF